MLLITDKVLEEVSARKAHAFVLLLLLPRLRVYTTLALPGSGTLGAGASPSMGQVVGQSPEILCISGSGAHRSTDF